LEIVAEGIEQCSPWFYRHCVLSSIDLKGDLHRWLLNLGLAH